MARDRVTPDDSVTCGLCGKETSLAMIAVHLANEHGIDPREIANAPVYDDTVDVRERPPEYEWERGEWRQLGEP